MSVLRGVINQLAMQEDISPEDVIACMELALTYSAKKVLGSRIPRMAQYDYEEGEIHLYRVWTVVEKVRHPDREIALDYAKSELDSSAKLGDEFIKNIDEQQERLWKTTRRYLDFLISDIQQNKKIPGDQGESPLVNVSLQTQISEHVNGYEATDSDLGDSPEHDAECAIDELDFPSKNEKQYFQFQKTAIKFIHERESVLLADEMGLGKTITVIGAINLDESLKKILIVCPLSIKSVWRKELNGWMVRKLSIGEATADYCPARRYDILILHYDIAHKYSEVLRIIKWDLIVLDEAHYIKSRQSQRTKAIVGFYHRSMKKWTTEPIEARKKLLLTGTPIMNRPAELWPLVNYLDKKNFGRYDEFVETYCDTDPYYLRYDQEPRGYSNREKLNRLLKSTVMIRRTKEEVLPELPKKLRTIMEVPATTRLQKEAVEQMSRAWGKYGKDITALERKFKIAMTANNEIEYANAVQQLTKAYNIAFFEMSSVRHQIGLQKVPIVVDHLKDLLASEQKIVVFAHHHDVIDEIKRQFPGSVSLTGKTPSRDRADIVTRFQNNPDVPLFIGNIDAAGMGITLNASSTAVFAELDWVPAKIDQAEDRLHRIGQISNVLVHHIVFEGSIDARMAQVIVEKQSIIRSILN